MIRINLLPFRAARKKENIRRQLSIFVLSIILVVLVMGVLTNRLENQIQEQKATLNRLQNELTQAEKRARKVKQIQKELKTLEQKMGVMESLEAGRRIPVTLYEKLTESVVDKRMWLARHSVDRGTVKMDGFALDDKTVADFMTNLEESGLFSSVSLVSVKKTRQQDVTLREFSLSCRRSAKPSSSESKAKKK